MLFFKKKKERYSGYTIDLGKMREKGIIKDAPESLPAGSSISSAENSSADSLGFLGSLASAGSSSVSEGISEQTPVYNSPYHPQVSSEVEGKLGSMSERLYRLIDRIELIERKLERIERKLGYGEY